MKPVEPTSTRFCWAMGGSLASSRPCATSCATSKPTRDFELEGMATRTAIATALDDLGEPEALGRELRASRGTPALRRPLFQPAGAVLVERAHVHALPDAAARARARRIIDDGGVRHPDLRVAGLSMRLIWRKHELRDRFYRPEFRGMYDRFSDVIHQYVERGDVMLDAGCGSGRVFQYHFDEQQRPARIVGVDMTDEPAGNRNIDDAGTRRSGRATVPRCHVRYRDLQSRRRAPHAARARLR